jgi:hypothetical protein
MADLVTIVQAEQHLRLTPGVEEDDLELKISMASAIVLDYLSRPSDVDWQATINGWTPATVPKPVQAAVLLQLGELFRFRGDDDAKAMPDREHGYLAPGVVSLLYRYRDPALA